MTSTSTHRFPAFAPPPVPAGVNYVLFQSDTLSLVARWQTERLRAAGIDARWEENRSATGGPWGPGESYQWLCSVFVAQPHLICAMLVWKLSFRGVKGWQKMARPQRSRLAGKALVNCMLLRGIRAINDVAASVGMKARIALRINPDVDPKTHPYISTGMKKSKFGIAADRALEEYKTASSMTHIDVVGVHAHIGSQLTDVTPFVDSLKKVVALIDTLKTHGINIRYLNIGGGLGITYSDEKPPLPQDLAHAISPLVKGLGLTLVMEPGRVIVGNAGILVTKALYEKAGETKHFVIVDAAMNDLIRPSLYGAYHEIRPVNEAAVHCPKQMVDIVGPVCESGDFLAKERSLPNIQPDDLLAVMSAGAYGFVIIVSMRDGEGNSDPFPRE